MRMVAEGVAELTTDDQDTTVGTTAI